MNKVMLIGYVGVDPQVRYLDEGTCVAQLRLGTTEKGYTLQNGTQVPERTEWHNLVFWRKTAEIVEKYVRKGDKLYVEGKIQSRDWTDKRGISRRSIDIIVDSMEMLSPRRNETTELDAKSAASPTPPVLGPESNGGEYPF